MPILVDKSSRVLYQGVAGDAGTFDIQQCLAYGTAVVGLVDSTYESKQVLGLPVFQTVWEARRQTKANVSVIRTPPCLAADAILEAEESGIELIICETAEIPKLDLLEVERVIKRNTRSRLLGPGSFGVISPERSKIGAMPGYVFSPGPVGIISRASTLAYEVARQMTHCGTGQSSCVGIGKEGGDSFVDLLALFEQDIRTEAVLIIAFSEEGVEAEVAAWAKKKGHKPIAIYIAGENREQQRLFTQSGIVVVEDISKIGKEMHKLVRKIQRKI